MDCRDIGPHPRWLLISLVLAACSVCAQHGGVAIEARIEPGSSTRSLRETDVRQLAAESPQHPVAVMVHLAPAATLETVADFVFEKRIEAISVYMRDHITENRYRASEYTLSTLGPSRAEQLARARCHLQTGTEMTNLGAVAPPGSDTPRGTSIASLMLPAREAVQLLERPPAIVASIDQLTALDAKDLALTREITTNVLTLRLPVARGVKVPPACDRFLYPMPR
jgi:hypothetical protein